MLIIYHIHKISVSKNIFGNRFFYTDRKNTIWYNTVKIKVLLTCKNNEIIVDKEDINYFSGNEYRNTLKTLMNREPDKLHMIYFIRDGLKIGTSSYCIYKSEDGKCFI